jgi:hypothetical protein
MSEEMAPDSPPGGDVERTTSGARLMSELRQAQTRADRAERELDRTKRSAAYVVGDLLVRAAKDPRRLLTLPRDMWRTWRLRRSRRAASATSSPIRTREVLDLDAARLLVPRIATVPPGRGLSIAGAIASATARGWAPYAAVSPALPHEAAALIEAIDPDIVVIDTSAALPGEAWAHLGEPAASDRLLAAGSLVDAAHALGRPAVLLRMTSPAHTAYLDSLARRCDLVVDGPGAGRRSAWHPGVDPLAATTPAEDTALLVTASTTDVVQRIAEAAPRHHRLDPSLPDDVAWSRALAASTGLLAEAVPSGLLGAGLASVSALAAGRRVLGPGDTDLARMLAPWDAARTALSTSASPAELIEHARSGPLPLAPDEHRAAFAAILVAAAAPVQLTVLAQRLGVSSRPRSCWDVALLADGDVDVDRVLAQAWRPRELIVTVPLPDRARAALDSAGIDVVALEAGAPLEPSLLGIASPYLAQQINLHDPRDLLDLLAGHLLAQPARPHPTDARLVSAT